MTAYKAPLDDIRFLLKDVFRMEEFWTALGIDTVDAETADAILEEAGKVCEQVLAPLNREADEEGCEWRDGEVSTPKGFKEAYRIFSDGGWNAVAGNPEYEGMGMPKTLVSAIEEMVQGACMSFGLAPMLTAGAAFAINSHASDVLKKRYLPKMYSGRWSGAMDLTEPHAGTDLGLIRTKAVPLEDGSYAVSGTKIFITWGEHDMAENIVHLVLAKLPDAPEGSRGISLFLVPKFLPDENGEVGERNGVHCGSIEKKMGIKASSTCVMNFDNAKGWMIGEANRGLAAMFTMMNYERLLVGIQGMAVAEASYQSAAGYARERLQSRAPAGPVQPEQVADPIIAHADVRRMLLTMRAFNEGGRAFYIYVAKWLDMARFGTDEKQREQGENMVALLTPVAKAFMTDVAFDSAVLGQQVFGGHGFIREWGQEQHVRDIRITQIYEGTNGIQAMDLIGRKTVATQGGLLKLFASDVEDFIRATGADTGMDDLLKRLQSALDTLTEATEAMLKNAQADANVPGAVAMDYLHLFGYVAYAYMWAQMAVATASSTVDKPFAKAKLAVARYYFLRLLPQVETLKLRVMDTADAVMGLEDEAF